MESPRFKVVETDGFEIGGDRRGKWASPMLPLPDDPRLPEPLVDVYRAGSGDVRLIDNRGVARVTLTADDLRYLRSELAHFDGWDGPNVP